jgi:TMEM175 potassium channel family protein
VRALLALAAMQTSRLETFSDGVFAIAITLLVLLFEVPDTSEGQSLGHVLTHQWPSYASYVVSFVTIGIIWVNHHTLFRHIARVDRVFLFVNVLFLMCVAFLPYPTAVIAKYVRTDDATAAAAMYGISLTATAIFFNVLWQYAARGYRLLAEDADRREVAGITRSYWPGAFLYAAATGVAFLSATASVGLYVLLALFYVLSSTLWSGSAS